MTGYVFDKNGRTHLLPVLTGWEIIHTTGKESGGFTVTFLYQEAMLPILKAATRFQAYHDGMVVFYGVVDGYSVTCDVQGAVVKLYGRTPAALLMDNEAESGDYYNVSLEYILKHHVSPWGVTDIALADTPALARFTVASGQSEWSVLREFLEFSGGLEPRFTAQGKLLLDGKTKGNTFVISGNMPLISTEFSDSRYGVISEVLVKQKRGSGTTVQNERFLARGGSARQVLHVPRYLSYDAMRYSGEYQIRRSREGSVSCVITLPMLFPAFAGDTVRLDSTPIGLTGTFRVSQSRCWAAAGQYGTELTLAVWEEW